MRPAALNLRRYPFARGTFGTGSTSVSTMLAASTSLAAISQILVLPAMPAELNGRWLGQSKWGRFAW